MNTKRNYIDLLVRQLWSEGLTVVSRKFGSYLSEPAPIGNYEVDLIARYKKDYVIGLIVSKEELSNSHFMEKIRFLSSRKTKYTNREVALYLGVSPEAYRLVRELVNTLDEEKKQKIKIFSLFEKPDFTIFDSVTADVRIA
ncbi:MAG: hypothetical protein C0425_07530 [Chlorobiaceae bacterium]|nr:hypothetical protein [Chlorobiaceae bacterium]MBA4310173.1 hypothetical protein [Chlorobiaceae bacterium]